MSHAPATRRRVCGADERRAALSAGIAEIGDLDELLAAEHARPYRAHRGLMLRQMLQQLQHVITDLRQDAEDAFELACRGAVDREPAKPHVDHLHEGVGALDDVGEYLAFRDCRCNRASSVSLSSCSAASACLRAEMSWNSTATWRRLSGSIRNAASSR
jgi:hypothetical protein